MSRVVMAANGSWGDVLPFVAVAHALEHRGHAVEFVLPTSFHARVSGEGFTVRDAGWQVGPDELAALDIDWARGGGLPLMRSVLRQLIVPKLSDALGALEAACAGADLLVIHVNQIMGPILASRTGIPTAALSLFPMVVPSVEGLASTGFDRVPRVMRRPVNRALITALLNVTRPVFYDRALNRFRAKLGLCHHRAYFMTAGLLADRYLALFPPSFAPRPADWPSHVELTGFCPWAAADRQLPAEINEFLAAGEPPVLVTMGSAGSSGLTALLEHVASELDRRHQRSLFLLGDPRHRTPVLDRREVVEFAPIDRVLPHCRAIVHHGGYGTTVAALRAGIPAVTVSPMPDQLWYGRRAADLGTGIALPWRRRRHVGDAIDELLGDQSFTIAARDYREVALREDGITNTCNRLETLL
jgi:sterol 3beta-glucosyltransferase